MALRVRLFRNRIDDMLYGASGPVNLHKANVGRQVAGVARTLAPRDTGKLAGSIRSRLVRSRRGKGYDVEVTANTDYAIFVHRGTRAHWPPPGALTGWASRHGFPPNPQGAFLVGQAISKRARPPDKFLVNAARAVGLDTREIRR